MDTTYLTDAEALILHLERDPILRSTIVAVARLDRSPDWDRFMATIDRATRLEPRFRRRISPAWGPVVPARWVEDPDFDLSWHVRRVALPAPGTFDQVLELARVAGTTAFDPVRPRWELTVVEGLAEGGAALVLKVHHALTDGLGGIQLAQHLVDLDRRGSRRPPVPEPWSPSGLPADRALDAVTHDLGRLVELAGTTARQVPGAVARLARRPLSTWVDVGRSLRSAARFVEPITSTRSPIMTRRGSTWHYHALEVPLSGLRAAAAHADATVNDAFLAAASGGLARYHRERGAPVDELRVTMPISVRRPDDPPGGNRITLVRFPIPLDDHSPICRMIAIDHATSSWRDEPATTWNEALARVLNLLPTSVSSGLMRHVDFVASNVPGFDRPVYVAGARVETFHAFGPTLGTALNVLMFTYCDRCEIAVTIDASAVDDPDHLLRCLREGFDEVIAVGA